jgi:hypothetical protein
MDTQFQERINQTKNCQMAFKMILKFYFILYLSLIRIINLILLNKDYHFVYVWVNVDYTIYITPFTIWKFYQGLNLQGDIAYCHCCPISSFHMKQVRWQLHLLCCYSKRFAKVNLNYYYHFHIISKWKKKKKNFILEDFFKTYTFLLCLREFFKNCIKITFESCNLIHFNNDALKIYDCKGDSKSMIHCKYDGQYHATLVLHNVLWESIRGTLVEDPKYGSKSNIGSKYTKYFLYPKRMLVHTPNRCTTSFKDFSSIFTSIFEFEVDFG